MRSAIAPTHSASSSPPASPKDWRAGGFGVYVHWPFCAAKCPYCDFNSHVRRSVDQDRWRRALVSEIERIAAETPGRRVDSVFFGGGTPSLMPPETVAAVLDAIRKGWRAPADMEVTLEANPTSVEAGRFRGYAAAGVNRLSMGVQALNDADLRALGRMHTVKEAIRAFEIARGVFGRVSFDLIYARQGQDVSAWRSELREALAMAVDHLSLYQLTIEAGTRFGELHARGRLRGLPDGERSADMYLATQEICEAAGIGAYEVSNHARAGAESRHNLVYWRYGDYAGIGPGAHGRLTLGSNRWATEAIARPEDWLAAVERGGGVESRVMVSPGEQAVEMMMMGLRLSEGVSIDRFETLAGRRPAPQVLTELAELGLLEVRRGRLHASADGRTVLNSVIARIIDF